MNAIQKCLKRLPDAPIGGVVHVQAAETDVLEWALLHQASHVLLIASEEEALDALRGASASRREVDVIDAVVSGRNETVTWSRFNVHEVNGTLEPATLRQVYPRLQMLDQTTRQAIDLPSALKQGPALSRGDKPNLLVLDVPGRELSVLAALPGDTLSLFDWVLMRAARQGLYEGGSEPQEAHAHLKQLFFRLEEYDDRTDPLWPVALFSHDKAAAERHVLEEQLKSLQQILAAAERKHAHELAEVTAAHTEDSKRLEALTATAAAAHSLAEQRKAQLDELTKAHNEQSKKASENRVAHDEASNQAAERQKRVVQLEAELKQVREAQTRRDADGEGLKTALLASEKLLQTHLASIERLGRARDEYAGQATERQKQVARLEAELAELAARQAMLQEELVKAEAHVELISDLLFREPLR